MRYNIRDQIDRQTCLSLARRRGARAHARPANAKRGIVFALLLGWRAWILAIASDVRTVTTLLHEKGERRWRHNNHQDVLSNPGDTESETKGSCESRPKKRNYPR